MADAPEQGNSRHSQAQAQVGEVVDIMRVNVKEVLERDSKLSELDQRADNLSTTCRRQFVADNLQEGESVEMVEAKDDDGKIEYPVEHMVDFVQKPTQVLTSLFHQCDTGCICAGHKEGAEVSGKSATGEKFL